MKFYQAVLLIGFTILLYILYAIYAPNIKLVEKFRNSMEQNLAPKAIDYKPHKYIVLDVKNIVNEKAGYPVAEAKLTIYLDSLFNIKLIKVGKSWPVLYPDGREADPSVYGVKAYRNIVENWLNGQEWERQTDPDTGITYWVIYPCKLEVTPADFDFSKYNNSSNDNSNSNNSSDNSSDDNIYYPNFPGLGWP